MSVIVAMLAGLIAGAQPASAPVAAGPEAPRLELALTGIGRFAIFADISSITPDDDGVRMRALQISEDDLEIGGVTYVGGWSWWVFNCDARTADRLDFASLRADGVEGPTTPERAPPYPIAPGGDAAELAAVACRETVLPISATTASDAVHLARARMAED